MKKKYVAIILAVFVLALIFTFGQVFTIKSVNVVFENDTDIATDAELIRLAGVEHDKNIFSFNERKVVEKINSNYSHALKVNVERQFPNKVVIKVTERLPVMIIEVNNDKYRGFVATDKDFQRTIKCSENDYPELIKINGYSVQSSFDTKECMYIREFINDLIKLGIKNEAINVFIDKIYFNENNMMIQLSQYNAKWQINCEKDLNLQISHIYQNYNNMPTNNKYGNIFI